MALKWPPEKVSSDQQKTHNWFARNSNYCLDFHGDPCNSELGVFSDGNHHMALQETLESFRIAHRLNSIFYCTTPPQVYLDLMREGKLELGNLRISADAEVIIGPDLVFEKLRQSGIAISGRPFIRSLGCSLLVAHGNPMKINSIGDLLKQKPRLFISNPVDEKASYDVYRKTITAFGCLAGYDLAAVDAWFDRNRDTIVYSRSIHHREAPQAIASGDADVAVIYHHLALRYTRIFANQFALVGLPFGKHNPVTEYHVGLLDSENALAAELVDYLLSEEVVAIYERHGLSKL